MYFIWCTANEYEKDWIGWQFAYAKDLVVYLRYFGLLQILGGIPEMNGLL